MDPNVYYNYDGRNSILYEALRKDYLIVQHHCLKNNMFDGILIDFNYNMEKSENSISNQFYSDLQVKTFKFGYIFPLNWLGVVCLGLHKSSRLKPKNSRK